MTHLPFVGEFELDPVPDWERRDLEEPSFLRHPRCIPLLEGTRREADGGFIEARYAPRAPRWSTSYPTVEGFFHVRLQGDTEFTIVRVRRTARGALEFGMPFLHWQSVDPHYRGLEWSDRKVTDPE